MALDNRPLVIIVGAGFGGLHTALELARHAIDILVIDRNNFHTFTPLLYQVATCALDPSEIAYPVRSIFRKNNNVNFLLGEVTNIDYKTKRVIIHTQDEIRHETYDYLVIAAGSVSHYFGNKQFEHHSFDIKELSDTVRLRNHVLKMFEQAIWTEDDEERKALTTIVVVGGGPTGLETAGALYELYNHVLTAEYNRDGTLEAHVILVEAENHLLRTYPKALQEAARKQLESLGVKVVLGQLVEDASESYIQLTNGDVIRTHTLVWAAGVKASPMASWLDVDLAAGGRIPVKPTMEVIGRETIYAAGDISYLEDADGQPYPQLIPVAQQQGKLVAHNISQRIRGLPEQKFEYHDRGVMATIGRSRAVAWPYYRIQLTGFIAWIAWLTLHLIWLMGFRNQLNVLVNWTWNYLSYDRSVRIILEHQNEETDE